MTTAEHELPPLSDRYGLSPQELASPDPRWGDGPFVFDWQDEEAPDFAYWGGLSGIAEKLDTSLHAGLSTHEAFDGRVGVFGSNDSEDRPPKSYWELIREGLQDFTLLLLLVASVVSAVLGVITEGPEVGWYEGAAIMLAVALVLNVTAISDMQRDRQFRELSNLNSMIPVRVIRDGEKQEIWVNELQVGDLLSLSGQDGDVVPADCLFVEQTGSAVKVDESMLTGESIEVTKNAEHPYLVSGTLVKQGACTALVVAVGDLTVQGRAAALMNGGAEATPLQRKLEKLALQVSYIGFTVSAICLIVMTTSHLIKYFAGDGTVNPDTGEPEWLPTNWSTVFYYVIISITVIVVAIPEGLPLAVTISLAYSVKKMMKDNNLVRHLAACETMGGATTICSDKTGTLTQNKMKICQAWMAAGADLHFLVGDAARASESDFIAAVSALPDERRDLLLTNGLVNSTAFLKPDSDGKPTVIGSKTEGAFLLLADALGMDIAAVRAKWTVVKEYSFTSSRKRSGAVVVAGDGGFRLFVKGASEMVLRLCSHVLDADGTPVPLEGDFQLREGGGVDGAGMKHDIVESVINPMADAALRTIAIAYRDFEEEQDWDAVIEWADEDCKGTGPCPAVEDELTLVGVVGIADPLRPEVPGAVLTCQKAGITVRMVTGDNLATAKAIAKDCHIYHADRWTDTFGKEKPHGLAMEGPTFREMAGGLVLPPHFNHECKCEDLSGEPFFAPAYESADGLPSILGHCTEACELWTAEAIAARGDACTDECKKFGCHKQVGKRRKQESFLLVRNQAQFDRLWPRLEVLARSAPTDKHLLVTGLIERGQVVAVTGDGTNDGPALSRADVGFAMGSGTEVAKQASDIVLIDDNFNSIVAAVSWGRNVYDNIRKFLQFQLTVNFSALCITFLGSVILTESPLRAVQLLWVNLIMNVFAALALATEPPTPALLQRKPHGRSSSLISNVMLRNILAHGLLQIGIICTLVWAGDLLFGIPTGRQLGHSAPPTKHYTIVFQAFVCMQIFNEINARKVNNERNVFDGITRNPLFLTIVGGTLVVQVLIVEFGGKLMGVAPLSAAQHAICIGIGLLSLPWSAFVQRFISPDHLPSFTPDEIDDTELSKWGGMLHHSQATAPSLTMLAVSSHHVPPSLGPVGKRPRSKSLSAII